MDEKTSINIKLDKELQNKFKYYCELMGITVTFAIVLFIREVVKTGRIPFPIFLTIYDGDDEEES